VIVVMKIVVFAVALGALSSGGAKGQEPAARLLPHAIDFAPSHASSSTKSLYLAALGGGVVGFLGGGVVGAGIDRARDRPCGETCGLGGFLLGSLIGGSTGMAVGAHLANDRTGNVLLGSAATLGTGVVGVLAVIAAERVVADRAAGVLLAAVPLVQIHVAVTVERASSRRQ
jgi:hypothetical protein